MSKYYDITQLPEQATVIIQKNGYGKDYYNLKKENELLKEELTNLKNDITRVYNTMISLETINKQDLEEDIEEI